MKKTTRITVETETLTIIRQAKAVRGWCPDCRAEVNVINLNDTLTDPDMASLIQQWVGGGKVHSWQSAVRQVQICLQSLLGGLESSQAQRICRCIENQLDDIRRKNENVHSKDDLK